METEIKGTEQFLEKIAIMLNPKKKTNKVFYFILFAVGYLIFDFFTSQMLLNEYMTFRMLWLQENSKAVMAIGVTSFLTLLSYMGFNLKGSLFVKFLPKILQTLGFKDVKEVNVVAQKFIGEQKAEAIAKIKSRISDNLKNIFDIEHKLNTPNFLTLEQRDQLLEIGKLFVTDLYNDGKEYVLNYNVDTPLKDLTVIESVETE